MERRELLSLGGIAAIAGAFAAAGEATAQEGAPAAGKRVIRIYADADGNSQIQELPIATKAGRTRRTDTAPVTGLTYAEYTSSSVAVHPCGTHASTDPLASVAFASDVFTEYYSVL